MTCMGSYNAAEWLVDRHVADGRGDRVAVRFRGESMSYADVQREVFRAQHALADRGVGPGDRVAMRKGVLFVNGVVADDYDCIPDRADMPERTVPADRFFVLGDNRPISCDSREFGLVPQDLLKGKVRVRFWPLDTASLF